MFERSNYEPHFMDLRKIILDGVAFYRVWQKIDVEFQAEYVSSQKGFWWQHKGFLSPVRNTLFMSTLMQLSKVFDTHSSSVTLTNLVANARSNPKRLAPFASQEQLENIQIRISRNFKLLERLRNFRNKRLAHHDPNQIQDITPPSDEVDRLIQETIDIFNALKFACEGKQDNFDDIMENVSFNTSQVICLLKESSKR